MVRNPTPWGAIAAWVLVTTSLPAQQADLPGTFFANPSPEATTFLPSHVPLGGPVSGSAIGLESGLPAQDESWSFQWLPEGLIYRSYLAGVKEPRLASVWDYDKNLGWIWDVALGGRVGLMRYGTERADRPDGWELDVEGAALARLDYEHEMDVVATDFRAGLPLTYGYGPFQFKLAYYHLSSHLVDEFMLRNPDVERINYVRDAFVLGGSWYATEDLRLYAEAGWSFHTDGGAEPWEFQFGVDFSPAALTGVRGAPFAAINGHLLQEVDFGGHLVVQAGWQWRNASGRRLRIGAQYFNGKSDQYEFFDHDESKIGAGVWYDF